MRLRVEHANVSHAYLLTRSTLDIQHLLLFGRLDSVEIGTLGF